MILLTGGAGYIGSHTNKELHHLGYETIIFDNCFRGHRDFVKWGHFFRGDLSDGQQLIECFKKYPISSVFHFGALAYVGESVLDPARYYQNNVVGTLKLLEAMRYSNIKKLIFSSSCATYGNPMKLPISEDHIQNPINPYGRSKLMIEHILQDYDKAYGIKYINLRYFNAAGADPDAEIGERHTPETHLIPLIIFAALGLQKNVSILGTDYKTADGTCIRDYIHVTDIADAHIRALHYLEKTNESTSFNLGNSIGYSVYDVIKAVEKLHGKPIPIVKQPRRIGDPEILISSFEKAKTILNWQPQHSFENIIQTAWNWHSIQGI